MRYLGKTLKGPKGELLYPVDNAGLAYDIDINLRHEGDHISLYNAFFLPIHPDYANKDANFTKYIAEDFPKYL